MSLQPLNTSASLPGWFGKLPGMGDFAHRRLPEPFRERWDHWLQSGLAHLRGRHADWTARYLEAPLWFFVLGEGVAGRTRWQGVMMPSVDGVGRYFPFTLARELGADAPTLRDWWVRGAQAALEGLENDLDALRFDALLQRTYAGGEAPDELPAPALPAEGQSLWRTHPDGDDGVSLIVAGLPRDARFEALFGYDDAAEVA